MRSLSKIKHKILGQEYFVKKHKGLQLLLDRNNLVDRHIDTHGEFEPHQMAYLQKLITENQCEHFIDIGAHWGLYTLTFKALFGDKMEYTAFEPDEFNRYQLFSNLFLNRFENVDVRDNGLSDRNETLSFHRVTNKNRGANRIANDGNGNVTIQVKTGDECLPIKGKKLAIKIDVEEHEIAVLTGLKELLANNDCVIQVEAKEKYMAEIQNILGSRYKYLDTIEFDSYFSSF